jgi:peptidoglycan/xylan/chitin deacetylase (PgdA/CDA1 family)
MTSDLVNAAYRAAGWLGLPALSRGVLDRAVILCYHNVVTTTLGGDASIHLPLERFESQMRWLKDHCEVVSLAELVARLRAGRSVRRLAVLTFDDGYTGFFQQALPVLRSLGLPSAAFLVAQAATDHEPFWWDLPAIAERATPARRHRWLWTAHGNRDEILAAEEVTDHGSIPDALRPAGWALVRSCLGPDLTIGAHTVRHRCLPTLSDADLRWELDAGLETIAEQLGQSPAFLAYPYGAWDARVRAATVGAGYTLGLTLDPGRVGHAGADLGALPRVNVPSGISDAAFEAWASGLLPLRR